ncbi:MAG: GTPase [Candidatus Hydrogenedentota bacterium]
MTRISIVGRPNVGKSSLLNAILKTQRSIVSEIPGTTRDAVEEAIQRPQGRVAIVDTAGIRKKRSTFSLLENIMVGRTRQAVERSDVVVVMTDAVDGVTDQDVKIVAGVMALGKACVLAINKWDIAPSTGDPGKEFDRTVLEIRRRLKSEAHVPIISISALKHLRIARLLDMALETAKHGHTRIRTSDLNRILADVAQRAPGGLRIKYGIQRSILPPSFLIFGSGRPSHAIMGFIRNSIRKCGGFEGVPILLEFRR